jgi:hypothetical protein
MKIIAALAIICAFSPVSADTGPSSMETVWRTDISNGFARHSQAWADYQLRATQALYNKGDVVEPAPLPSQVSELFTTFKLRPLLKPERTFSVRNASALQASVCVSATLYQPKQLAGFVAGVAQASALYATNECQRATLNSQLTLPTLVYAFKVVSAKAAQSVIEKDQSERAAQAAVAGTIAFARPVGNLMDFDAAEGGVSEEKTAVLSNTSGFPWGLATPTFTGPFVGNAGSCSQVAPTGNCLLNITFTPTQLGGQLGSVTLTTSTGHTLILRLRGVAVAAP